MQQDIQSENTEYFQQFGQYIFCFLYKKNPHPVCEGL